MDEHSESRFMPPREASLPLLFGRRCGAQGKRGRDANGNTGNSGACHRYFLIVGRRRHFAIAVSESQPRRVASRPCRNDVAASPQQRRSGLAGVSILETPPEGEEILRWSARRKIGAARRRYDTSIARPFKTCLDGVRARQSCARRSRHDDTGPSSSQIAF